MLSHGLGLGHPKMFASGVSFGPVIPRKASGSACGVRARSQAHLYIGSSCV